jgi:pyruvate-formate lyase-activating enzyme
MCRFVRFHTLLRESDTHLELGIFTVLYELKTAGQLTENELDYVQQICDWFNHNLKAPRLCPDYWRARFWFRDSAQSMVTRLWDLAAVLQSNDVPVRFLTTRNPGTIVYADHYQVAAIIRSSPRRR